MLILVFRWTIDNHVQLNPYENPVQQSFGFYPKGVVSPYYGSNDRVDRDSF